MPIYVYKCRVCGRQFEKKLKMGAPNPRCDLPENEDTELLCGGQTDKVPARTTFHLKGGGWYKDGYGSG